MILIDKNFVSISSLIVDEIEIEQSSLPQFRFQKTSSFNFYLYPTFHYVVCYLSVRDDSPDHQISYKKYNASILINLQTQAKKKDMKDVNNYQIRRGLVTNCLGKRV